MGIPGFYGHWLSRYVQSAIIRGLPSVVSSLSFDLNGVIHDARAKVYDNPIAQKAIAAANPQELELELFNTIASIILKIISAVSPRDTLILAVDGPAPLAKNQQQRGRREKAAREQSFSGSSANTFDRNAITPGTEFMIRLDRFIIRFLGRYRKYLPPKVIYSNHLVPGEGEHKIMDYYRDGTVNNETEGVHVLYGLDADLVMLSLVSPLSNIYLSRETTEQVVSIEKIKDYLITKSAENADNANIERDPVHDFVVIMLLIGNDFLPHSPSLETLSESVVFLLDTYANGSYKLTVNGEINWEDMAAYVSKVAESENEMLRSLSMKTFNFPSRFMQASIENGMFYPSTFRDLWYNNALGPKGSPELISKILQIIGENATFGTVTSEAVTKMCVDYMRTMSWVYLYYLEGTNAVNNEWAYPYYHTPMLIDLSLVMNSMPLIAGYKAVQNIPFTALHQLVAVMPMRSKEVLPIELQSIYEENSMLRDLYPETFIVELDGKDKEHQGVPIVPIIDRNRIMQAVAQISFTPERAALWLPGEALILQRTEEENLEIQREIAKLAGKRYKPDDKSRRPEKRSTKNKSVPVIEKIPISMSQDLQALQALADITLEPTSSQPAESMPQIQTFKGFDVQGLNALPNLADFSVESLLSLQPQPAQSLQSTNMDTMPRQRQNRTNYRPKPLTQTEAPSLM